MFRDELSNNLAGLFRELFGWIVKPIKGLFGWVGSSIRTKYTLWVLKRKYTKLTYVRMLRNFCSENNIGLLVFDLHNGVKSISGYSFMKLGTIFLEDNTNNVFLHELAKISVPATMYSRLIELCFKCNTIPMDKLTDEIELQQLFKEYKCLHFGYSNRFYVIMCKCENTKLDEIEEKLIKLIGLV